MKKEREGREVFVRNGTVGFELYIGRVVGRGRGVEGTRRGRLDIEEEGKERAMYVRNVCFSLCF